VDDVDVLVVVEIVVVGIVVDPTQGVLIRGGGANWWFVPR